MVSQSRSQLKAVHPPREKVPHDEQVQERAGRTGGEAPVVGSLISPVLKAVEHTGRPGDCFAIEFQCESQVPALEPEQSSCFDHESLDFRISEPFSLEGTPHHFAWLSNIFTVRWATCPRYASVES